MKLKPATAITIASVLVAICFVGSAAIYRQHPLWLLAERPFNELAPRATAVLTGGARFFLMSLNPAPRQWYESTGKPTPQGEEFHDYFVQERIEITDKEERAALIKALVAGIAAADAAAACFNPRHGISAEMRGEKVDLVICFECLQIRVYGGGGEGVLTTRSAEPAFNAALHRPRASLRSSL